MPYDVRVEHRVSSGKSSHWKETFRDIASTPFFEIEDESGIARVETRSFKAAVVRDENRSSGMFNDASPELEALLATHGHTSTSLFGFNKNMRYAEGAFEVGEVIAVIGRVRLEDDPEGAILSDVGFRDQKRQQRVVIEANPEPVRATDDLGP